MIIDSVFLPNAVLETGMQVAVQKNDVISNNITNADTPYYKKQSLVFEESLSDAINDVKVTGSLDLSKVKPTVVTQPYDYRLDNNGVDIETEMVDLYQNSARYDVMTSSVMNNYKRLQVVLR